MYADIKIVCRKCGKEFIFTASEQEFYTEKGFRQPPKRCKACRRAGRGRRPEYTGTCACCGREAQVPFQPAEDRMLYCRQCFAIIKKDRASQGRSR